MFMSSRSVLAVSALLLGTALTAVPALAQTYGNSDNSAPQYRYPTGRAVDDGGMGYAPQSTANYRRPVRPIARSTARNYSYPVGRAMNDGGFPPEQAQYNGAQREERTGSAENVEHAEERSAALAGPGANYAANYAYDQPAYQQGAYYDYYGGGNGPGFAGGGGADQEAIAACAARFHSFDPATGTYLGFDGMRHTCP
jgi:hypothetical protein